MEVINWKQDGSIMPNEDCFVLKVSETVWLKLQIYSLSLAVVSLYANINYKRGLLEIANHATDKRLKREYSHPRENAIEEFKSAAVAIFKEQCDQFNNLFNQQ